jgi:hypothetical protein
VFEKVIQEVCDASVVDFEESGVDQKTLNDLKDVSFIPWRVCIWTYGVVFLRVGQKRGNPRCGRRCLWGNTGF